MMSRTQRVDRLIQVRSRSLDTARTQLAQAAMAVEMAERRHQEAERTWFQAAEGARSMQGTLADHELEHQRIHLLRIAADEARTRLVEARVAADAARKVVLEASQELRKFELWRDSLVEAARVEDARRERIQNDEVAARRRGA